MQVVRKVSACLVRDAAGGPELLVFDHPTAGTQIPKGTLQPGEAPAEGVLRELAEETGVSSVGGRPPVRAMEEVRRRRP